MNQAVRWSVLGLVLLLAGVSILGWYAQRHPASKVSSAVQTSVIHPAAQTSCGLSSAETVAAQKQVVMMTHQFSPAQVTIRIGQTVQWLNNDSDRHKIASDPHPLHSDCIGLESGELENGKGYSFTFTQPGTWRYHDHLNPRSSGSVVVTE